MGTLCWIFGVIGAVAFAINLLPQLIKCYKEKSAEQISVGFLILAFMGNICSAVFVFYTNYMTGLWQYPIFFNYGVATILTTILSIMKWKYNKRKKQ
jgi:uncharacterized protein with PQ loop repeat